MRAIKKGTKANFITTISPKKHAVNIAVTHKILCKRAYVARVIFVLFQSDLLRSPIVPALWWIQIRRRSPGWASFLFPLGVVFCAVTSA